MKDYVTCPACKANVALPDHTLLGELVKCSACGVEFEVLSLGPFIPDWEGMENWEEPHYQVTVPPVLDLQGIRFDRVFSEHENTKG